MEDWFAGLLFVMFTTILGAFLVLLGWGAVHFIIWAPITDIPWAMVRAGCAVGAMVGITEIMKDS